MKKIVIIVIGIIIGVGLGWLVTCGILKLITLCFGWQFNWLYATGIWLILCLCGGFIRVQSS